MVLIVYYVVCYKTKYIYHLFLGFKVCILLCMDNKKLLGKRIKELRKNKGYTQEQLSELVGIETSSLSGIESGRFFPSLHVLEKMSVILNIQLVEFFNFFTVDLPDNIDEEINSIVASQNENNKEIIYKLLKAGFSKI